MPETTTDTPSSPPRDSRLATGDSPSPIPMLALDRIKQPQRRAMAYLFKRGQVRMSTFTQEQAKWGAVQVAASLEAMKTAGLVEVVKVMLPSENGSPRRADEYLKLTPLARLTLSLVQGFLKDAGIAEGTDRFAAKVQKRTPEGPGSRGGVSRINMKAAASGNGKKAVKPRAPWSR